MVFHYEQVKSLNELELVVYRYIIENQSAVQHMTIRELSEKSHVSTTTILRFCSKVGCSGYSELKFKLRELEEREKNEALSQSDFHTSVMQFLRKLAEPAFEESLGKATNMIVEAEKVIFLGVGTSGIMCEYGERFFSNCGIVASSFNDPYFPIPTHDLDRQLVIALSVSGESVDVIRQVVDLKNAGANVIAITNAEDSSLARLADLNISYYVPDERLQRFGYVVNLTTHIPVVGIIEILAHRVEKLRF